MVNSRSSISRRLKDRGVGFVLSISLKWDSKKTFAAAVFSTVAMDGWANRGESWRGN